MHRMRLLAACALVVSMAAPGIAQAPRPSGPAPALPRAASPGVLPGTPASAFAAVTGRAISATSVPLPRRPVRLRDARIGRAVAAMTTSEAGAFAFSDVDPGSYIIELLGADQSIHATSQLFSVNAGEAISVDVKLPSRLEALAGFLGHSAPQAAAIAAAAAAAGVLAVQSTTDVSPR